MKKLLLVSLCLLVLCITQVFAQNRTVTGTVTAKEDGLPIPGVTVKIKGTSVATATDVNGKFSLGVPVNSVLVVSFIGYTTQEVPVTGASMSIVLVASTAQQLGEVVVTGAFGIKRQARELGNAATTITAASLTEAHPSNFTNGLTAKAPGLVISTLDNGVDPQTRFTLRGNRHIFGSNYALVVLNGVPISPNDVETINPDDIESVDILNGAGAAALYGSEASNGALIITTKKGSANGAPTVIYQNTFELQKISYLPAFQTQFGSYGGEGPPYQDPVTGFITTPVPFENQSYGPAYDGHLQVLGIPLQNGTLQKYPYSTPAEDPRRAFFNTGHQEQNNISFNSGDANNYFNLSAYNLINTGIVPNDSFNKTNVRVAAGKTYGIFKADFNVAYFQSYKSTYGNGFDGAALDGGRSLLSSLFNTPSWVPLENFKNLNAPFSDVSTYYNSYGVNPYWIVDNSRYNTQANNFNGSFQGVLSPTKWFDATYRIADNFGNAQQVFTRAAVNFTPYAVGDPTGGYTTEGSTYGLHIPGQVQNITQFGDGSIGTGQGPQGFARIQQDILLNFHHTFFNDFKGNLILGNTIWQEQLNQISNSSTDLLGDNFYNIGSILGVPTTASTLEKIRQIAYFGDLQISYKDFAFLEGTLRNDHDSRLATGLNSFYYPSIKGSFIFSDVIPELKDSQWFSYGKLRGSYSQVGDVNLSPYSTQNTYTPTTGFPYGTVGGLTLSTTLNNPLIKPELTKEIEFGGDFQFWNSRISAGITYYKSNTTNETIPITTAPETGYANASVNIGNVQNTGMEYKLDVQVLTKAQNGVGLTLGGNLSIQNSKVISLTNGLPNIALGGYSNAEVEAVVGQPFPVLMGTDVVRDPSGHVVVDANTGYPSLASNLVNLGRTTPKYILGLTQTVSYKFVSLTAVSEFRTGFVVYDEALSEANASGISAVSASAGRTGFVFPNSVIANGSGGYTKNTNVVVTDGNLGFWDAGAYYSAASSYVTSAAFWKLREADINFDLTQWVKKSGFIKKATFGLVGRNLIMLRPKSNNFTDPEFSFSSGNAGLGITNGYQLPPTRLYGATLNITF